MGNAFIKYTFFVQKYNKCRCFLYKLYFDTTFYNKSENNKTKNNDSWAGIHEVWATLDQQFIFWVEKIQKRLEYGDCNWQVL